MLIKGDYMSGLVIKFYEGRSETFVIKNINIDRDFVAARRWALSSAEANLDGHKSEYNRKP